LAGKEGAGEVQVVVLGPHIWFGFLVCFC
jgi:hypothetical protein